MHSKVDSNRSLLFNTAIHIVRKEMEILQLEIVLMHRRKRFMRGNILEEEAKMDKCSLVAGYTWHEQLSIG